jgi:superfamily I DNA/RNA helicase
MSLITPPILDGLNEAQKRTVTTTEGPLLVVAGPGTGKTLTIVRRIAHLVQQGVRPENILAVTFTNRAAREMQERTASILGDTAAKIFIGTFHLLGIRIIQVNRGNDFGICSRDEQIELLKPLMKGTAKKAEQMAEHISRIKNFLATADPEVQKSYEAYNVALKQRNAHDFDDLIRNPIELLEKNDELQRKCQDRFQYCIVDEYQDINPAQYRLLKLLIGRNNNVCVVGDSDQAIYAFRGADLQNFLNFEQDFPGAARITLTENYRSTGAILSAADSVIKNNQKRIDKELTPVREKGAHLTVISVPDERTEGTAIIQEIEERIGGTSHYRMTHGNTGKGDPARAFGFSDFGVIYRTNAQAKALEEEFSASGIPYQVIGHKSSAQAKETEETLIYLRSLISPDAATGTTAGYTEEAKLLGPADFFDPRANVVTLMTLHMAKGLEFPVVFITGCEDGLIPCRIMKHEVDLEEERRLYYVGMTRAKDELFLLHSRRRFLYGQKLSPAPSPFLAEIPGALVKCMVVPTKVKKQKELDRQLGLF